MANLVKSHMVGNTYLLLCGLCFSISFFFIAELNEVSPIVVGIVGRVFFGLLFSLVYLFYVSKRPVSLKLNKDDFVEAHLLQVIPYTLIFLAEIIIRPEYAAAFMALVPIWVIIISTNKGAYNFMRQHGADVLIILLIFAMLILLSYFNGEEIEPSSFWFYAGGIGLLILSTVSYGLGTVKAKSRKFKLSPEEKCFRQHLAALPTTLIIAVLYLIFSQNFGWISKNAVVTVVIYSVMIGFISNFLAWLFYNQLIYRFNGLYASISIMIVPVLAYILAVFAYGNEFNIANFILSSLIGVLAFIEARRLIKLN